jgi:hypothetical protein
MSEKPFRLWVFPRPDGSYGLTLSQKVTVGANPNHIQGKAAWRRLVRLWGIPLAAVAEELFAALKQSGYRPGELKRERRRPFELPEEVGVRLGLLFMMVKPLSRSDRITAIAHGLKTMPIEEAYYWFSKCSQPHLIHRARRALRLLLAEE